MTEPLKLSQKHSNIPINKAFLKGYKRPRNIAGMSKQGFQEQLQEGQEEKTQRKAPPTIALYLQLLPRARLLQLSYLLQENYEVKIGWGRRETPISYRLGKKGGGPLCQIHRWLLSMRDNAYAHSQLSFLHHAHQLLVSGLNN